MVDYWARAEEGERVEEKDFDLKIFWKNLKRITRKHGIRYDGQNIVPQADTHGDLLDNPSAISEVVLGLGLDSDAAIEIVSIGIVDIRVR